MKLYSLDGIEVGLQELSDDSVVVMRVTKKMSNEEFVDFVKNANPIIRDHFEDRGIRILVCPDWIEFKEWK